MPKQCQQWHWALIGGCTWITHIRRRLGTWKKDVRLFPHDSSTALGAVHQRPRQTEFSLVCHLVCVLLGIYELMLWSPSTKVTFIPFYLIKDNKHKRKELRRPLQETGKAIFFKIMLDGRWVGACCEWRKMAVKG